MRRLRLASRPLQGLPPTSTKIYSLSPAPGQLEADPSTGGASAADLWALVPAVGRNGAAVPLQTFDELLRGIGNDGSRAHTMTESCRP